MYLAVVLQQTGVEDDVCVECALAKVVFAVIYCCVGVLSGGQLVDKTLSQVEKDIARAEAAKTRKCQWDTELEDC